MPRLTMSVFGFITAILCGSLLAANTQPTIQSFNKMPLAFTKNMGQWDERVLFRANAGGATMWFTKEGVTYQFTRRIPSPPSPLPREGEGRSSVVGQDRFGPDTSGLAGATLNEPIPLLRGVRGVSDRDSIEQLVLTTKFVGANANPEVIGEGLMEYSCSYFLGNDPTKWHTDVPNYEAITLKDIYPGIDLKYSGDGNGQAAYEFVTAPGVDMSQIKVEYEGVEETSLDSDGKLIVRTKWGDMIAAVKTPANGVLSGPPCFSQLSEKTIDFEAEGTSQQTLDTLAVVLSYSTYLGGSSIDEGYGIAVDSSGNAYVTGRTFSTNFPTQNAYDPTYNDGGDAFVAKFSPSGALMYSSYLGGGTGKGIAVDGSGNAYVTGTTTSINFPTLNPYQPISQGLYDAFVTKLNSNGNSLIYSTYLGGGDYDHGCAIAIDGDGNAFVSGYTVSPNFPTLNPYQTYRGNWDVFVTRLSSAGNSLIYSTYLGGRSDDKAYGIAVDDGGNAFAVGYSYSSDFPTLNPYQAWPGDDTYCNAFVTKLSSSGNSLIYSTYLGGGDFDYGNGIAVDGSGNAYVTGVTGSSNFPTQNAYQLTLHGGWDTFVSKLSSSGNRLVYSTYLGGGGDDKGYGIAVDGTRNPCVTGYTESSNFPSHNSLQSTYQGGRDAFVTKVSSLGNTLIYSTYLGGGSYDEGHAITIDGSGNAYVTGRTASSNFPTLNSYQTYQGVWDAFVTKLGELEYSCGDADGSKQVDLSDAVFLVKYIFEGSPAPLPLEAGDVDCNGPIDLTDVVYLVNYVFGGGPMPCANCK